MGKLSSYKDFAEKKNKFSKDQYFFQIDTISQFDKWYEQITVKKDLRSDLSIAGGIETSKMYRGMSEARHKLFTSAQRFWINNELSEWWAPKRYLQFVDLLVKNAKNKLLFKKVFEYYRLAHNQRDFPILSILQHYGAPTPLMDWTYNADVALYFATENLDTTYSSNNIDNYFSIYHIDKTKQKEKEFDNLINWHKGSFPQIRSFFNWEDNQNSIFYISDFEDKVLPKNSFKDERPITTIYNHNIIPQAGLFIFNPFSEKPLEDCFNTDHYEDGNNLELNPFGCINIHKDLAEYIRRRIKTNGIDSQFIYPELRNYCSSLIDELLDQAVETHNKINEGGRQFNET